MNSQFKCLVFVVLAIQNCVYSEKNQYLVACKYESDGSPLTQVFVCGDSYIENGFFSYDYDYCKENGIIKWQYRRHVRVLKFEKCELSQFPQNFFKFFTNIDKIDSSNIGLKEFETEGSINLIDLSLAGNNFTKIPKYMFFEAHNLVTLNLSRNRISYFDPNAFPVVNSLKILYLGNNELNKLHSDTFKNLIFLEVLDLSKNNISELPNNTFSTLVKLKTLSLKGNNFHELQINAFQQFHMLEKLDLSENKIAEIPAFLFHHMEKLYTVDFSYNQIKKIDNFAFSTALSLATISLAHNQLKSLDRQIFGANSNIKNLYISFNQITTLKTDTMASLRNLLDLDVADNPIKKVNNNTFANNEQLEILSLSHCGLSEIKPGTFSSLTNLKRLDLSHNDLRTLELNTLPTDVKNMKIAGIESNKFNCSYVEKLIELFTPQNLDGISKRNNCSAYDDETVQVDANETTPIAIPLVPNHFNETITQSSNRGAKLQNKTNVELNHQNLTSNENYLNLHDHLTAVHTKLTSIEKYFSKNIESSNKHNDYLFAITCLMAAGFVFIAIAVVWKMVKSRFYKVFNATQVIYRREEVNLPNAMDNNYYVIKIDQKQVF